MYGGFNAIVSQLAEKIGEPFKSFPAMATWYGMGGVYKWGTICGCLNGAALAINLVVPQKDTIAVGNEVIDYYCKTALPTKALDEYTGVPTTIRVASGSPLCHISRSKFEAGNPPKAEVAVRCSKLVGDVAARAVEILNAYQRGRFVPAYQMSQEAAACKSCHEGVKAYGELQCGPCHGDPHQK